MGWAQPNSLKMRKIRQNSVKLGKTWRNRVKIGKAQWNSVKLGKTRYQTKPALRRALIGPRGCRCVGVWVCGCVTTRHWLMDGISSATLSSFVASRVAGRWLARAACDVTGTVQSRREPIPVASFFIFLFHRSSIFAEPEKKTLLVFLHFRFVFFPFFFLSLSLSLFLWCVGGRRPRWRRHRCASPTPDALGRRFLLSFSWRKKKKKRTFFRSCDSLGGGGGGEPKTNEKPVRFMGGLYFFIFRKTTSTFFIDFLPSLPPPLKQKGRCLTIFFRFLWFGCSGSEPLNEGAGPGSEKKVKKKPQKNKRKATMRRCSGRWSRRRRRSWRWRCLIAHDAMDNESRYIVQVSGGQSLSTNRVGPIVLDQSFSLQWLRRRWRPPRKLDTTLPRRLVSHWTRVGKPSKTQ